MKIEKETKRKYKIIFTGGYADLFKTSIIRSFSVDRNITIKGIVELSLNNFNSAVIDFNQFINLVSSGHPDYFQAFHERGIAQFFNEDLVDACIDWNYAAENGYFKSIKLITH